MEHFIALAQEMNNLVVRLRLHHVIFNFAINANRQDAQVAYDFETKVSLCAWHVFLAQVVNEIKNACDRMQQLSDFEYIYFSRFQFYQSFILLLRLM